MAMYVCKGTLNSMAIDRLIVKEQMIHEFLNTSNNPISLFSNHKFS